MFVAVNRRDMAIAAQFAHLRMAGSHALDIKAFELLFAGHGELRWLGLIGAWILADNVVN